MVHKLRGLARSSWEGQGSVAFGFLGSRVDLAWGSSAARTLAARDLFAPQRVRINSTKPPKTSPNAPFDSEMGGFSGFRAVSRCSELSGAGRVI